MAFEETIPGVGGSDTAVVDPPAEETITTDVTPEPELGTGTPEETGTPEPESQPDAEGTVESEELEADGRKVTDANLKKAIAEMAKTDKASAKAVRDIYFRQQAVMKEFPEAKTLGDALTAIRQAKATIETLGGQEGITEIQNEVADYRKEIEAFSNGDRGLLEQLHEANPEALITAVSNGLAVIKEKNPKGYDLAILPDINDRLAGAGFDDSLVKLAAFIQEGKGQEAYDLVASIGKWRADMKKLAEDHATKRTTEDPRIKAQADADEIRETAQRETNERIVASEVNRLSNRALSREVEPLFKQLKLNQEGRRRFIGGLQSEVWKAMKGDKIFQRDARNVMKKGDREKSAAFIAAKFAELLPVHFKRYRDSLYPNLNHIKPGPGDRTGAKDGKPGAAAGKTIVVQPGTKPKREDVDWTKTNDLNWISGKGIVLLNGKTINVDWKSVRA